MSSCYNTLVYIEELSDFITNPDVQHFVYGSDGSMQAVYIITKVYDLRGNVIGNTRYDSKLVSIPGAITETFTAVTQLTNQSGNIDLVYTVGTRKCLVLAGGLTPVDSNVTVQKLVVDGITYDFSDYKAVPIPETSNQLVTIEY